MPIDYAHKDLACIFNVEEIQSIMQDFSDLTNMVAALLDLNGEVLVATGWQPVCTRFHRRHSETAARCTESDLYLIKNLKPGEYVEYQCKNGLWDVVTPLFVEGEHWGNIYTGQFFYDDTPVDEAFFTHQADTFNFDRRTYLDAVRSVPRFSREKINQAMRFLVRLTGYISKMGAVNIQLEKEVEHRREAENTALENQLLVQSVIRAIPDLVWFKDLRGAYISCNARFERFFGAHEHEIIGKTDYDFLDKQQADAFREHDQRAIVNGKFSINEEKVTFADDGHEELLETIKTPIRDSVGQVIGVLGVARDITSRKQIENELRYKETILEDMGRIAKIGGWRIDPATGEGAWTAEVARIHDLDPADRINVRKGLDFYTGSSREKMEKAVQEIIEFGTPYDLELEIVSAKGIRKWVYTGGRSRMVDGKTMSISGYLQDVTERKQAEMLYRENSERLRLALQAAQMGAWEWDINQDYIVWSPESLLIFGTTVEHFDGSYEGYLSFVHPDMRVQIHGQVQAFLSQAKPMDVLRYDHKIIRDDGTVGWVSVRGTLFADTHGQSDRLTGVYVDITERKQTDIELEALRHHLEESVVERTAQLAAANKELESFSYSVSHDLRAPLRAIDGYSRMLVEDYGSRLDDEGRRICSVISDSAKEMGRLIDDLLAFSRVGRLTLKPSPVDMAKLANAIFYEVTTEEDRLRIDWCTGPMSNAWADPVLIRQVWANLLNNAVKYSSNKERARIEVMSYPQDGEIIYAVCDNGAGFDMQYADKLFGVFQRLHSMKEFPGTGVGLAIVQRVIHRHGGRVWAIGEINGGATFYFSLKGATVESKA